MDIDCRCEENKCACEKEEERRRYPHLRQLLWIIEEVGERGVAHHDVHERDGAGDHLRGTFS